jgi:hypothetical protein
MIAVLFLAAATLGGMALTLPLVRRMELIERLALGVPLGQLVLGLSGFVLAWGLGLGAVSNGLALALTVAPLLLLRSAPRRARLRWEARLVAWRIVRTVRRPRLALYVRLSGQLLLAAVLFFFFRAACTTNAEGLFTNNPDNLGDLPYHVGIIQGFVRGENYPPEHPEFAGARLTYPFLVDFVAAQLIAGGTPLAPAIVVQDLFLIAALTIVLHRFARRITGSALAAHLALPVLFFSGGWGFLRLAGDVTQAQNGLGDLLWHLPHAYTNDAALEYRWGNLLTVLLGTQRSLLMGMPLGIAAWSLWWRAAAARPAETGRLRLFAGLLAGALPLTHIHTFLMLLLTGGAHALLDLRRWRSWLTFFVVALVVAAPQLVFMLTGSATQTGQFAKWSPGWDSNPTNRADWSLWDLPRFWLLNTGLTFPLLLVALLSREREPVLPVRLVRFYLPLTLCFIVPNLFQLAPWVWDNIKVLIYAHVASAPLIAALLAWMWRRRRIGWRVGVGALLVLLTASGALDVTRVISEVMAQRIFSADDLAFGDAVARTTPPRSRVLCAPTYNHGLYWSGRRAICGYGGHLWSHGLNYGPVEEKLKRIYKGEPDADALLRELRVDYVVVGPRERADLSVNEGYLARFPVVVEAGGQRLLSVQSLTDR